MFACAFGKIEYELHTVPQGAVWDGVVQADSMWAYPQQGSYKMKLREVYKDYARFKSQKQHDKFNSFVFPWLSLDFSFEEDLVEFG